MTTVAFAPSATPSQEGALHLGEFKFLSVGRSDPGRVRKLNEDAFLERADIGLWAVADGLGGHHAGEVASAMVVEALSKITAFSSAYAFRNAVSRALHEVNANLVTLAEGRGLIGSTIVALLVHQGHYACIWAGDSRAYLYRDGALRPLTRDHSHVQALVDRGHLSQEDARKHGAAHVITRAVGAAGLLELESGHGRVSAGDRFILCSDGLTGMLRDAEIAQFLKRPPLERALEKMLNCALARGAPDNVTAVLIGAESRRGVVRPK